MRITISFKSYDIKALNYYLKALFKISKKYNVKLHGPVPLPTKIHKITLLRSPHVNKKSREQFEIRNYHRIVKLGDNDITFLNGILNNLPYGVSARINISENISKQKRVNY